MEYTLCFSGEEVIERCTWRVSILYQSFLFDLEGSRGGTRCVLYLPLGDLDRGGLGPGCLTTGGGGVGLVNGIYGNSTLVVLTTFGKGGIFGFTV